MYHNLNNEEYYCQFWKKHFSQLFSKYGITKVNHKNNVEIGHYDFATKIAYGFPNCRLNKKIIHDVFKNESYYPKSISFNKNWAHHNSNKISQFINNKRTVLKNNFGVGGHTVYPVYSAKDVLTKMNNKDDFILQKEIKPLLHKGLKLDERVFLLVVKEGNKYSGYTFIEEHIKLAGFKFSENGTHMGAFATNIKAPKPNGSYGGKYTIDTREFYKNNVNEENQKKWNNQRLHLMKEITKKILPVIAKKTKEYYRNKKEPKYIWHVYGLDLLVDNNYNLYLCEFNGKPGVIYDAVMPKEITAINRVMCDRIFLEFLARWILNLDNRYYNDPTITKLGEFGI